MIDKTLQPDKFLNLINSKNRVVFVLMFDVQTQTWDTYHDSGAGYGAKNPRDTFLTAACCLMDAPSCKISGQFASEFEAYCRTLSWLKI